VQDFEKTGGIIALIGVALAAIGGSLQFTRLGLIGLGVLGVGVVCWGVSGVIEGRMIFSRPGVRYRQSYYGLAARLWGVLICMAGVALVGLSFLLFFKPEMSFEEALTSSVGKSIGMLLGGLTGMLYGMTLILGRAEDSGSWLRKAISLPGRILGVFVLVISIGLAAAGVVRLVTPQVYDDVVQAISDQLPRAPQLDNR
jgi:hypothetical protein